jgi:hypothetical protein
MNDFVKLMRPCVARVFEKGARDRNEFEKMRHAIIYELRLLEVDVPQIKLELLDWNMRNTRKLSTGDAQRQLCDYVDWFFKNDCKMSCRYLSDYCGLPEGTCMFSKPVNVGEIVLPFDMIEAMNYLVKEYRPHGYAMGLLIRVLFKIQREKNAPKILYVGVREIRARLNSDERLNLDEMSILRLLNRLEEAGILKITHGKSGTFGKRTANEYTFLPWTRPVSESVATTHNNSVCVTV